MDMWLACHTQQEIADAVGLSQPQTADRIKDLSEKFLGNQADKTEFRDGFDPPLYNVWKQQDKSNKVGHFGNSEERWVDSATGWRQAGDGASKTPSKSDHRDVTRFIYTVRGRCAHVQGATLKVHRPDSCRVFDPRIAALKTAAAPVT
jgi:hypothetical protein